VRNEVKQPLTLHAALQNNKELKSKIPEETVVLPQLRTNFPQKIRQINKGIENKNII